jgi:hypothetical protein
LTVEDPDAAQRCPTDRSHPVTVARSQ